MLSENEICYKKEDLSREILSDLFLISMANMAVMAALAGNKKFNLYGDNRDQNRWLWFMSIRLCNYK